MKEDMLCVNCGFVGQPRKHVGGSMIVELALWLFMILPGLIYSVWRLSTVKMVCPKCEAPNMIPKISPMGCKILNGNGDIPPGPSRLPPGR